MLYAVRYYMYVKNSKGKKKKKIHLKCVNSKAYLAAELDRDGGEFAECITIYAFGLIRIQHVQLIVALSISQNSISIYALLSHNFIVFHKHLFYSFK